MRVTKYDFKVEGSGLRVRGEITNACAYVVTNVRVQVEALDKSGQSLGKGDGLVDPAVVGVQTVAQFDVPIPTQVEPAMLNIATTFRRAGRY